MNINSIKSKLGYFATVIFIVIAFDDDHDITNYLGESRHRKLSLNIIANFS